MSNDRRRTMRRFNAGRHIVMGLVLMALAYAVVHFHKFGTLDLSNTTSYTLAGIMMVYGLFRIWRGTRELNEKDPEDYIT